MPPVPPEELCAEVSDCCAHTESAFRRLVTGFLCNIQNGIGVLVEGSDDVEFQILCDEQVNGTDIPFVKRVVRNEDGTYTITNLQLDYTTVYIITGTVHLCPQQITDSEVVPLCDVTALGTVTEFLRRYNIDDDGVVTIVNTTLDGSTPYVLTGGAEVCKNSYDHELEILSDQEDGCSLAYFLRRYTYLGNLLLTTVDTTLNGSTPYVVMGVPVPSMVESFGQESFVLCDVNAGVATQFLRRFSWNECGGITYLNLTLDGQAVYVPTGTVGICQNYYDHELEILCEFVVAEDVFAGSFLRRYTYLGNILLSTTDTELDGSTAYVLAPGSEARTCPGVTADGSFLLQTLDDTEAVPLCDNNAGVDTQFLRTYIYGQNGGVDSFDYQLDGVTPYVPTGTVSLCTGCCSVVEFQQMADLIANSETQTFFLRKFTTTGAGVTTQADFALDGTTPYVVVGLAFPVGDKTEILFIPMTSQQGGSTTVDTPFLRRIARGINGTVLVTDVTLDGTTAFVPAVNISLPGIKETKYTAHRLNLITASTTTTITAANGNLTHIRIENRAISSPPATLNIDGSGAVNMITVGIYLDMQVSGMSAQEQIVSSFTIVSGLAAPNIEVSWLTRAY